MDLLDRLLKHDQWTTRQLLALSAAITDEQLDRPFDLGLRTVRLTLIHIVENTICWTRLMTGIEPFNPPIQRGASVEAVSDAFDQISDELFLFARQLTDDDRLNETFVDLLDSPARRKSFGAGIVHIATHNMHHRAQLLYMLRRLQVPVVPEGDAMGWERQHVGGWDIA